MNYLLIYTNHKWSRNILMEWCYVNILIYIDYYETIAEYNYYIKNAGRKYELQYCSRISSIEIYNSSVSIGVAWTKTIYLVIITLN